MVDFIFVVIELFRYLLRLRRYKQKPVEVDVGVGHFERRFQREGGIADQPLLVSSSRVIALSCGIKISAAHHLILSQFTRVLDGQTDGQTDRITTPKTALAYAREVKTEVSCIITISLLESNVDFV